MSRAPAIVMLVLFMAATSYAGEAAPTDLRELEKQAKRLFISGQYREALEIYSSLYAESNDPIHLRNTARCHQELRQPDQAIYSFRRYLNEYKKLDAKERKEVEGYIREMEALKEMTTNSAPVAPSASAPNMSNENSPANTGAVALPAPSPPGAASPTSPLPLPMVKDAARPAPLTIAQERPSTPDQPTSVTRRWWFWGGMGAVIVVGVLAAVLLSARSDPGPPACPPMYDCGP